MNKSAQQPPAAAQPTPAPCSRGAPWQRWHTLGIWLALLLALWAVFGMYRRPDFLLTLADQLWSCF